MIGPLGRQGLADTLGQHRPLMTQRPGNKPPNYKIKIRPRIEIVFSPVLVHSNLFDVNATPIPTPVKVEL